MTIKNNITRVEVKEDLMKYLQEIRKIAGLQYKIKIDLDDIPNSGYSVKIRGTDKRANLILVEVMGRTVEDALETAKRRVRAQVNNNVDTHITRKRQALRKLSPKYARIPTEEELELE